jgi:peroxiredoxin
MRLFAVILLLVTSAFARELPLSDQLGTVRLEMRQRTPKEVQAILDRGIADLKKEKIEGRAPKLGATFPDFTLPQAGGGKIHLSELLAKGPVVLTFYRGSWCPYCTVQLLDFEKHKAELDQLGATLVAISPELPEITAEFMKTKGLDFPLAWDKGNGLARKIKIVYGLPEDVKAAHQQLGIDLKKSQGNGDWNLPVPATFVLDKSRKIHYAHVDADYTKRAETVDVLAAIKNAKK